MPVKHQTKLISTNRNALLHVNYTSLLPAAVWHGTEHVSEEYSTVSTHLRLHFILKNHTKSKLDCNIMGYLRKL